MEEILKLRFYTFLVLTLTVLLLLSAVQADNSSDSSAFVCLQKVQKNIVLNNYIQVTDNKNYSYSGYFKGIDYEKNKITFLRNEPGVDAIMKSMQFDDISQIIVQKKKLNKANMRRWAIGGIFAGFSVAAIKVIGKDKNINGLGNQKKDLEFTDFIIHSAIGGGIGAFIGLISGGKVTVSQTITCEK